MATREHERLSGASNRNGSASIADDYGVPGDPPWESITWRDHLRSVDLPGFGHSEMPNEPVTIPFYGRLVEQFLEKLNIEKASIVGNSMGGFVAVEHVIKHPERVERLALVSAAGVGELPRPMTPKQTM